MADKVVEPVEFGQAKLADAVDPVLLATLDGMAQFSKNVSELTENLVTFFTITKY
jgi:hypothetical protein